jgi:hypothetical protein
LGLFHRFVEFQLWLKKRKQQIEFINPYSVIQWNINKKYMGILQQRGVNIPPTLFLEPRVRTSLTDLLKQTGWSKAILKPAIEGGARHTYLFNGQNVGDYEHTFQRLVSKESMLVQEFQEDITSKEEVSFMIFGGQYSHAAEI